MCIFIKYAEKYTNNYCRIWCEKTNKYYLTRDVAFCIEYITKNQYRKMK